MNDDNNHDRFTFYDPPSKSIRQGHPKSSEPPDSQTRDWLVVLMAILVILLIAVIAARLAGQG